MYQIIIPPSFKRELKRYVKKYRNLKDSIIETLENFNQNLYPHLGNNIYKIRLKTKDISKGKSKSFRLIVLLIEVDKFLVPITIYFKGDQQDISKKELNDRLENVLFELKSNSGFPPTRE